MDEKREHSIMLVDRQNLSLQGVQHVDNFDDDTIVLLTTMGPLTVRGHNLRIEALDLEQGRFVASGEFDALQYGKKHSSSRTPENPWKKLWR